MSYLIGYRLVQVSKCSELNGNFIKQLFDSRLFNTRLVTDLFHYGDQIKYSCVLMLISFSRLATTRKFQENFCFKMRAVGPMNIYTKESKGGRHLSDL